MAVSHIGHSDMEDALRNIAEPDAHFGEFYELFDVATAHNAEPIPAERFAAIIAAKSDDAILDLYAEFSTDIEVMLAAPRWALSVLKADLERRMNERRQARGGENDHGPISIPHERIEIENVVEWQPYQIDAEQVYEGLRGLPQDEIDKLVRVEPATRTNVYGLSDVQVAAVKVALELIDDALVSGNLASLLESKTTPERVSVRNTATLLAWLRKNAGSARAKVVASAITRTSTGSRTTIKPKKLPKQVQPVVAPVAIEAAS